MAILKNKPTTGKKKVITLANNNGQMSEEWRKLHGKTILEVDGMLQLVDIHIGSNQANDIKNLVLEFKDRMVAFPLSRGLSQDVDSLYDQDTFFNSTFYVSKKMLDTDEPGEPTGADYISFGKPSGITMELESLVNPKASQKGSPVEEEEEQETGN